MIMLASTWYRLTPLSLYLSYTYDLYLSYDTYDLSYSYTSCLYTCISPRIDGID